jgi:hypothetical protein
VVDVRLDAGQAEGLAGAGEHAGALGNQVFDAGPRGGGVVEDFDGKIPAVSAAATRSRRSTGAGSVNGVAGTELVMVP